VPETFHVLNAVREMVQGIDDLMAHVRAAGEQQHWTSVINRGTLRGCSFHDEEQLLKPGEASRVRCVRHPIELQALTLCTCVSPCCRVAPSCVA
jgi:hypothetical protein